MLKVHSPGSIAPPFSTYSPGMEAPAEARWLYISGQVGVEPDGTIPEDAEAQMECGWRNILAILGSASMGPHDLVKLNGYITRAGDVGLFRTVRERMIPGVEPASTLVVVSALAQPEWVVEIEAIAAAA